MRRQRIFISHFELYTRMKNLLKRLWSHLEQRRKRQFVLLLILMLLASFAEVLSIGMVLPFLGLLTNPERVFALEALQPVVQHLSLTEPKQLLLPLTLSFGFAALAAGSLRLLLLWANTRLSYAAGADLSITMYRRTLYQRYEIHCARNSSEVISGISEKTVDAIFVITNLMNLISSAAMLGAILIALLYISPEIAEASFLGFGSIYILVMLLTRKKLIANSKIISDQSIRVIKALQEGLGGIRDVLINGSQETYCKIYSKSDLALRQAQGKNQFIALSPRYSMEAIGMVLVAALAYFLAKQPDGFIRAVPTLGALAIGAQRLIPVMQQMFFSWSNVNGSHHSLVEVLYLLDQKIPDMNTSQNDNMVFENEIILDNVSYSYQSSNINVINGATLKIKKGARVGFVGSTGSGKTTLINIIMGLIFPTSGSMLVDGVEVNSRNSRKWQDHIAHVPQEIYLSDSTIEENIAFGVTKDDIDHQRVKLAAMQAQIATFVETLPDKYQTRVGERGVRLSGGQRQRIGIARALYKKADVIIFDEATSALDSDTENEVISAIEGLGNELTVLMIAHRVTTLKSCSDVFRIECGNIVVEKKFFKI